MSKNKDLQELRQRLGVANPNIDTTRPPRADSTDQVRSNTPAPAPPDPEDTIAEHSTTSFDDELETAVLLSDEDIESIEMMEVSGVVEKAPDDGPDKDAIEPSIIIDQQPGTATWDDVTFYHREAVAIGEAQPERAGLMWFETALAAQLARAPGSTVQEYLHFTLAQTPENPALVSLVRREMFRLRQYDRALELTARLVKAGGDSTERIGALIEAATLQRHVKRDNQGALSLLRQALALQPANVTALTCASIYQTELGLHEGAAESLEQLAEVLTAPLDRSACLYAAATLRELRLDQQDRAEQNYVRALELDPENMPAWIAASHLHLQNGAWHRLCTDLEQIAALQAGNDLQVWSLLRAGVHYLHRTEDLEAAARVFSQAAEVAPTETTPLSRLVHVYEATGRVNELVTTLQRLLSLTLDPPGQAVMLMRIGHLLEFQVGHIEEAVVAYHQALDARPGHHPALQALGAIYRRHGDYERLLEILLPEAEGSSDPIRRAMRCVEVGGILVDRLQRPEEAIDFYKRAVELDPDLRLAAWRLGSLFHQHRRYAELAKLLTWQIETTTDDRSRFHLLMDLARLQSGPLDAAHQAIETLKRAFSIGQNRVAAMQLLELYNKTGEYSELVDLLLWEADQTQDLPESTWRKIQAAMLLEDHLQEHDRALSIFWDVLGKVPTCVGAIRAAGQIYYAQGRWQELIKLHLHELDNEPDLAESGEPWCRIGRIHEENLGEHTEAIEAYKKALALDSSSNVALDALERLIRIEQRYQELVPVLERYAGRRREPHAAADIFCRAAELADARLQDPARAAQLYEEALKLHPASNFALQGLADIQQRQKNHERACATLQRLIEAMGDAESQRMLLILYARIMEFRLDTADPAAYDMAAQIPKIASRIRLDLIRARLTTNDEHLSSTLLAAGKSTDDDLFGAGLLAECGLRAEWRGELDRQLEAANRALSRNPADLPANWSLQRSLRATGEWARLAQLLEGEATKHKDPLIRVSLLGQATQAQLAAGDPNEAGRLASQCLEIDKQHVPSLRAMVRLAAERQNHTELASLYDQLAASCADTTNRFRASLHAADCWSEYVGDPVNALASLKRTLAEDPQQDDAFARAWRILFNLGDFGQLSQLYTRRINACEDPEDKARLLRHHVRLLCEHLGDTPGAIAELNRLLELNPGDVQALQQLADLTQAAQRWSDASDALAQLAQRTEDLEQRQQAWLGRARIALKRLQKPREALSILKHLLQEDPTSIEAKRLLVEVYVEEGQWQEARRLLDEISAEGEPELQVWAMIQHAEVARVGLRDEKTQDRFEREALAVASAQPNLLEPLVDHYRKHRRQKRLLELATRVERPSNPHAAARLQLVLARLLIEDFNQAERATEYLRDCLAMDPKNVEANLLMGEALEHRGEIEGAATCYRKLLADNPRCVEAYRGINRLMGVLGKPSVATAAAALLDVLGASTPAEKGQVKALDQLGAPPGLLQIGSLPLRPRLKQLSQVMEIIGPHLGQVYPLELRRPLEDGAAAAAAARRIAAVLGLPGVTVSVEGQEPVRSSVGVPPVLWINEEVARRPNSPTFRFWVGRALAASSTAGALTERLTNGELGALIDALFAARPNAMAQQLRKQINRVVPRKVRRLLEQQRIELVDARIWDHYRTDERRRADVIGMLICGNPRVAITELAEAEGLSGDPTQSQRVCDLMSFVVSDRYAMLHSSVWSGRRPSSPGI
jgi:tetratricopeptide (TPR) repeat protein